VTKRIGDTFPKIANYTKFNFFKIINNIIHFIINLFFIFYFYSFFNLC
jgi:hypothetical protein